MTLRNFPSTAITMAVLASGASAQTSFPEIEPNTNKVEAAANGTITMVAGDGITGTTTGTNTTAGSTLLTSVDQFRVRTGGLPLGIYRHQLAITTTGATGHTGTIRGVNQTGTPGVGGTAGTMDVVFQSSLTLPTPAFTNVWYGFGKQEEIYYRVAGTAATSAPYVATLTTTPIQATVIPQAFEAAQPITLTCLGQTLVDTAIHVYDSNLSPIPGFSNNDPFPIDSLQSRLTRTFGAGTYYVSVGTNHAGWNFPSAADEGYTSGNLLDFPDVVCHALGTPFLVDLDFRIAGSNGSVTVSNQVGPNRPFELNFYQFTVANGAPLIPPLVPSNDTCAAAIPLGSGELVAGTTAGATNDGSASCDPGVGTSRDVWYSYTNSTGITRLLAASTCGTLAIDTVLSVHASCGGAELACNDDWGGAPCGTTSSLVSGIVVNHGTTVWIRVGDKGLAPTAQGDFILVVTTTIPPPPNDDCSTPIAFVGPGTYPYSCMGGTTGTEGQTEALCSFSGSTGIGNDVWYRYTPSTSGNVTITNCQLVDLGSPSTDTKMAVYSGATCPTAGSAIACSDDTPVVCPSSQGSESLVTFTATCGVAYLLQLGMSGTILVGSYGQIAVTETGGSTCATPITPYCFGDGTGTACPCGNSGIAGNGCASSIHPNGGRLTATGQASMATDTWQLVASGVPNGPGLFFQGTTQLVGGLGTPLGDGLRCAGGTIIRLGVVTGVANASTYPSPSPPGVNAIQISLKGLIAAGDARNYQLWYRDSGTFCTAAVFNLTNAVAVTWIP